jgi:hypothetical protein
MIAEDAESPQREQGHRSVDDVADGSNSSSKSHIAEGARVSGSMIAGQPASRSNSNNAIVAVQSSNNDLPGDDGASTFSRERAMSERGVDLLMDRMSLSGNDGSVPPTTAVSVITAMARDSSTSPKAALQLGTITSASMPFLVSATYDPLVSLREEMSRFTVPTVRVSEANLNYEICSSYPPVLLVPKSASDILLRECSKVRQY